MLTSRFLLLSTTGIEGAGMGRMVTLKEPTDVDVLVERVKGFLGLKHCLSFLPQSPIFFFDR